MSEKDEAFAEALYQRSRQQSGGMSSHAISCINLARGGRYASGAIRPAFPYETFGMTEQEWDALWALVYG